MYGGFVSWRTTKVLTFITSPLKKTVPNDPVRISPWICCAKLSHVSDLHVFGVVRNAHLFWDHLMSWRKCPEQLGLGHGNIANIRHGAGGPTPTGHSGNGAANHFTLTHLNAFITRVGSHEKSPADIRITLTDSDLDHKARNTKNHILTSHEESLVAEITSRSQLYVNDLDRITHMIRHIAD